ncbi:BrnT family toxin [Azospirillum sp. YIM B02556]|uniref:BrnT family toxin n=1 Tax=Azospirillum endophyticum TaxID=2800326 RepID=A0ABS1FCM0_9PROT|nr:BrnT family toxin [Azospirillum endophyticum]MBK1841177.1 BrnT family toxin [Azospirillum endophyticum]
MFIDFDPAKSARNDQERGLPFPQAARIFLGPTIEWEDRRHDYGERRIIAVAGQSGEVLSFLYQEPRHPREGGDPGFPTRFVLRTLDPRLRGDDGKS